MTSPQTFVWTDDHVELLFQVTVNSKTPGEDELEVMELWWKTLMTIYL